MHVVAIPRSPKSARKFVVPAALALTVIILAAVSFLAWHWPFSRAAVVKDLEDASLSRVAVGAYHGTYFPRPGCVLERVTFQHNPRVGSAPLITARSLRIEGSFSGLFTKHIRRIWAEGLRILIPPRGSGEQFQRLKRSTFVIDDLIADGGVLEVASRDSEKQPLRFSFQNFVISNVGSDGPATFQARFSNPEPPGEITTTGEFGPWNPDDMGKVTVSGKYLFQQADLAVFRGIAGVLSSSGKFSGRLNRIDVQGTTDAPQFEVTSSSHPVRLQTQFHAVVNGENGDTFLQQVAATFWKTTVSSQGSVVGRAGQSGKTASVEVSVQDGRIQDLLLLFVRTQRSPMSGIVSFHAKVAVPPGKRPFLEKVELEGDFGIDAGSFSKSVTQRAINHLSEGARSDENSDTAEKGTDKKDGSTDKDEDEENAAAALTDLKGHVVLRGGTARFSNLSFSVPGALARMQGTYNLITERIDLHGTLKTDSAPSKTTHGIKSVMLKVLDPFFKKKPADYIMPVKITGTYERPSFGIDLGAGCKSKPQKQEPCATK